MLPRLTGLWRSPDFMKLWMGQTISDTGSHITRDGLGLVALLVLHATPHEMGLMTALTALPVLVVGLFVGVPVDRFRRRPLMMLIDAVRLLLVISVPLALAWQQLTLGWLIVVAALLHLLGVVFDAAYRALLPALVQPDQLLEANAKLATTEALAEIGGSALAGLLIQVVSAPLALVVDAVSYLFSIVSFGLIRAPEKRAQRAESSGYGVADLRREIAEGIGFVARDPLLRLIALSTALRTFFGMFFGTLYSLYAVRDLGLTPAALGLLIACGGLGALAGAFLAQRIEQRWGLGRTLVGALALQAAANWLIPLAVGTPLLVLVCMIGAQLIGDAAMSIYLIHALTLRQMRVPAQLLGRVNASLSFCAEVTVPLGALAAGLVASITGTRAALSLAALGITLVLGWLWRSPLRHAQHL